ncbi:MFS transporter [Rhodococcus opacus]|uniref:MFS transporter n=1 Tax=Rhodococcus opacus TaxID=37919 RepID=A0AAX3YQX7_RHOOP|nr:MULTISPECIES: MFS transporter [Rhodococcus]MCZ4586185.1 MFS transporter [Rhodococcus opacus]QSE86031.1 MFS transporter [Rhodococcus koreensis]WLF51882.1 MFS transporter [Rhodococcus opacus]
MHVGKAPELLRSMVAAGALSTVGAIPVYLLSAQSVLIRRDLDFDEAQFGFTVSGFFAAAALTATFAGRFLDRLGRRRSTVLAGVTACAGGAGVALVAHSYSILTLTLVVLGVANAVLQITANLSLADTIPAHRQGLGFAVKQSAVPLAILIGGLSVPAIGTLIGWRWTFAFTAITAALLTLRGLRIRPSSTRVTATAHHLQRPPRAALVLASCGMGMASMAVNSLGAFVASWGFQLGISPAQAGYLMAGGSCLSICARLISGQRADRRNGGNLTVVIRQIVLGACGFLIFAIDTVPTFWGAAILTFSIGWAWPGLLLFAIVRIGRDAPGAASGALQAGAFAGGAAGPAMFGLIVSYADYPTAWRTCAAAMLVAAALLTAARRGFLNDLRTRPLSHPADTVHTNGIDCHDHVYPSSSQRNNHAPFARGTLIAGRYREPTDEPKDGSNSANAG